ncbi:MAG: transporter substrate-binding domain-containing protein [Treponema sp.]|jgi:PAS domain S-box-containing protein|nr:transporter substrate-binding domain-containing protein [Treponema sp.]
MVFVSAFMVALFSGCEKPPRVQSGPVRGNVPFNTSFRDIPGVTHDEINAIEVLQKKYSSFVFGTNPATGAFTGKNGEIEGYTALLCEWLTAMFGIPFRSAFHEWGGLLKGLENGEIDFTDEVMATPERMKTYYMTGPIIQRSIKMYRLEGSIPPEYFIRLRPLRYAFFEGSVLRDDIAGYDFETVYISSYKAAYQMLKNGEIDAYIGLDSSQAAFDEYNDVVSEDFYPLTFRSSCLSTQKAELQPVINVLQKALDDRTLNYLSELYQAGYQQYLENKVYNMLTAEERAYIQNNPVIPVAAEFDNYPICFFDTHTNQWQGIYFDTLKEIAQLTGLTFERVNDQNAQLQDLIVMLENGKALIISELFRTKEHEDRFLWSEIPLLTDDFAFLSKSDFRSIEISQIPYLNIGIRKKSIYSEYLKKVFPNHKYLVEYDTQDEVWNALKSGRADAIFACQKKLVTYTSYYEEAGYKLNLILNNEFDTSFGYNRDAVVLRSIIDKALCVININNISNQWMLKSYDYRYKVVEAQRPWLIGASVLFFIVLVLVSIFLRRSRNTGRQLEKLVGQRTNELALQTSMLKTILDSLPDAVFCKDLNFKYTLCNKYLASIFGKKLEDLLGKDDVTGPGLSAETATIAHDTDLKVINEHQRQTYEEWIACGDGVKRLFETIKTPLILNDEIIGVLGIGRDITQRKVMEEEVRTASRAKSAFLANMSHEIRTPLNVIIGLTDLALEDDNLSKHTADNLTKISNAGGTLLSIVNDILDFSKIESGKLELNPVEYYTSSLLNDIITLVVTRLGEKPITFRLNINDDLPGKLYGDDLRVKQILTNLLSNAVKYTHQGSIELSVRCIHEAVKYTHRGNIGSNVRCMYEGDTMGMEISVADTGIGIRKEDLQKLFSDYNQVDAQANRNIEGTGLGLAITKSLTEMMDGEISAESEYGKGTTFRLRVRQGFADSMPIGAAIAEKLRNFHYTEDKRIVTKRLVRPNLSYARVLVIDDMQTNLDVAAGILRKYKMQVDCLRSGEEAIDRIRGGNPVYNVVFMDHMMPRMDGIEAADAIRALGTEYARKIPIIALTANAIHGTEEMFYEHGFQAFISKPIDIMEMDSIIRKWVHNEASAPETVASDEDMIIDIPGVDTEKGSSLYGGEMDIYLPILRSFALNTPDILNKLRIVSRETLPGYAINVHGLKGASAGIGAEALRETALNLETMSKAGDLDGVLSANDKLIEDAHSVVANVQAWLERYDAGHKKPRLKAPDWDVLIRLRESCEDNDISGINQAMSELESADYEEGSNLVAWLREKIDTAEFAEAAMRLAAEELGR